MITHRLLGICLSIVVLAGALSQSCADDEANPRIYSAPPPMTIDTSKQYIATIETEKGNLMLQLFASDVPMTVNNFVFLAREGFYDGTTFHRVIAGFMAQGGDPTGTGKGTPGYRSMLPAPYQWLTLVPIPMAVNSSLPMMPNLSLTGNTQFLAN